MEPTIYPEESVPLFSIAGSQAYLDLAVLDASDISETHSSATIDFAFDQAGVSTINVLGTAQVDGLRLNIDLSPIAEGSAATAKLIQSKSLAGMIDIEHSVVTYGDRRLTYDPWGEEWTLREGHFHIEQCTETAAVTLHYHVPSPATRVIEAFYNGDGEPIGDFIGGAVTEPTKVDGQYGTLEIHPDGTYTYQVCDDATCWLAEDEQASDPFCYRIDNGSRQHTATLNIQVQG